MLYRSLLVTIASSALALPSPLPGAGVIAPTTISTASVDHPHRGADVHALSAEMRAGLQPHHNAGQDEADPLLFRHRFEHHDPDTDKLTYYQYIAKRHPHVNILTHEDVAECSSSMTRDGNITVHMTMTASSTMPSQIKAGNIVVAGKGLHCTTPSTAFCVHM